MRWPYGDEATSLVSVMLSDVVDLNHTDFHVPTDDDTNFNLLLFSYKVKIYYVLKTKFDIPFDIEKKTYKSY